MKIIGKTADGFICEVSEVETRGVLGLNSTLEDVKAARVKAEIDRVEAEKLAEEVRLAAIEAERLRQIEIEEQNKKLQAELAEQKVEADRLSAIAELEKAEMQKLADAAKKESDKLAAENQKVINELKAKNDAIELAQENERLTLIAEQKEKEANTKAALLAPDKEKVKVFFEMFKALQFPSLESEAGKAMTLKINQALSMVREGIVFESKNLL